MLSLLAGFLTVFCGCRASSVAKGVLDSHFLEGMSIGVCLLAVGFYGLCQTLTLPEKATAVTATISQASFCVFLVHIFFLKFFARLGLTALTGLPLLTIPLLVLLLLACGYIVWAILRRVPVANRWLI